MIELIKSSDNETNFVIRGINHTYANAIRRSAEEIPMLAVDTVEIIKNDSVLYDEMIALRIGLIPLTADKTYTPQEECTCKGKGCAKCTVSLVIKAVGPTIVRASDMKSKVVEPVYPAMPIVLLQEGQELEIVAEAKLGKGIEHAKFSPGLVWFRAFPKIELGKECASCKECLKACPRNVFDTDKMSVKNLLNCDLCNACVETCTKKGKSEIKISGSEEDFIFDIESWGQLPSKEIFTEAVKALGKNLKELDKDVKKL
jgi:DNA-directed RNA polymerase subunit D